MVVGEDLAGGSFDLFLVGIGGDAELLCRNPSQPTHVGPLPVTSSAVFVSMSFSLFRLWDLLGRSGGTAGRVGRFGRGHFVHDSDHRVPQHLIAEFESCRMTVPSTGFEPSPSCCTASCNSGSNAPLGAEGRQAERLEDGHEFVGDGLERARFQIPVRAGPVQIVEHRQELVTTWAWACLVATC